jgi:cytochrome c-type biogenesis protein CcmH/NrfG
VTGSVSDELARLAKLREDGMLTDRQFETQMARLLARATPSAVPTPDKGSRLKIGCLSAFGIVAALFVLGLLIGK